MRRGAAQVYAANIGHFEYASLCREHLLHLMFDSDVGVRRLVGECFTNLTEEHLEQMRPFIEKYLVSPSFLAGAEHLVNYLKPVAKYEYDLCLRVTSHILDKIGAEVVDMRTSWALLEKDLASIPLTIYLHATDTQMKSLAMDTFERLLLLGSQAARQSITDWDRR